MKIDMPDEQLAARGGQYPDIARVDVSKGEATRDPLPPTVDGFPLELLIDLSWTLIPELKGIGWWPVVNQSPPLGRYQRYTTEVMTLDLPTRTVNSVKAIGPWPQEDILADLDRIRQEVKGKVQTRLDNFARQQGFDSIISAVTYALSTLPEYKAIGEYMVLARDLTWAKIRELNADPTFVPEGWADVEPLLPVLELPQQ